METFIPFSIPRFSTLHIVQLWLWVSVNTSSVERSFSDEGLMKCDTDLWIYQILLGVILLLCVLVVVFGFL